MKISDLPINTTFEVRDRNKSIVIESPLDTSPDVLLSCNREVVVLDTNGNKVYANGAFGEKEYGIVKNLSEIAFKEITLPVEYGGLTLNVAQLAVAIEMLTDQLAAEKNSI